MSAALYEHISIRGTGLSLRQIFILVRKGGTAMVPSSSGAGKKTLPAHAFSYGGKYFLFDISTSFCFEVNEITYDAARYYYIPEEAGTEDPAARYGCEAVDAATAKIGELVGKKYFTGTADARPSLPVNRTITAIELHVVHSCNMNCVYCYGEGGSYGSEEKSMDMKTAGRAIDFLIDNSGEAKEVNVTFSGGEPLMNLDLVLETARYAREACSEKEKNITFNMMTNGTLLDQWTVQLLRHNRIGFMISMDGGKREQDYQRPLRNGESSYEKIVSAMRDMGGRKRITARSTVTKLNTDILAQVKEFKRLGFSACHFTPANTSNEKLALRPEDYASLKEQYNKIAGEILSFVKAGIIPDFKVNNLFTAVETLYSAKRRVLPCGAGNSMLCVAPDGSLYLCHRFAENRDYRLGDLWNGIDWERKDKYTAPPVAGDENCSRCWLKNICAGGCWHSRLDAGTNKMLESTPNLNECDLTRHIYELSTVIYNEIMEQPGLMEKIRGRNEPA